jgi:large repetitive protein
VGRHSLPLLIGFAALLLTPGAAGGPTVPGDPTPPVVTPIITGTLGANGWYVTNVTVNWRVEDPESVILETRGCDSTTLTTDTAGTRLTCYARSDGGETTVAITIRIDRTAPGVTATPSRNPDRNGWYNHSLTVTFTGTDATSGIDFCVPPQSYAGPDSADASVSGFCRDMAGNSTSRAFGFRYDATAPQVTGASASRPPDRAGWYNHSLTITFAGTDATSGVDACTQTTYSGPDDGAASVPGNCRDMAGNQSASSTFSLRYDATAPQVTATASRGADRNGWYNHALTVTFSGSDATSGVAGCIPPPTYSGPDSAAASVAGWCDDVAGNRGTRSFGFSYDATAPQTAATPSRAPDRNGWYNHALSVTFTGTDATSGVDACIPPVTYSGPDGADASVPGWCDDVAGNRGTRSFALRYDATGPQVTATPSRAPDRNGWYNHALTVAFSGSDATSGVDSCVPPVTYAGPDGADASVSGSCRDLAGNTTARVFGLRYDATAPQVTGASASRPPDRNGWYNHPLTVTFTGADATSGIDACTQTTYAGPDDGAASVSGNCRDMAGNQSGSGAFALRYDATAPQVTNAVAVRPPDRAGWYNHPVVFAVEGADATSGIDACPPVAYGGPDGAEASVTGACDDKAGNTGARAFPLRFDATGPEVTAVPERAPDAGGWYTRPLTVGFAGSDRTSGLESCSGPQAYEGPDSAFAAVAGSCVDVAGNSGVLSHPFGYDATAPQVTAAVPSRPPDRNGWYIQPLTVTFAGTDATSGIDSCTQSTYSGPDDGAASVSGSCRDRAGHSSGVTTIALKYDATAPTIGLLTATPRTRSAELRWDASPDTQLVEIARSPGAAGARRSVVYRGTAASYRDSGLTPGRKYRYTLTGYDGAENTGARSVDMLATGALLNPLPGARVSGPPLLVWSPVKGATYYNVVLVRARRVFSAWPVKPRLQLPRAWVYRGKRYRLRPGLYRWYVWPGLGRLSAGRFGRMVGGSTFVVTR